MNLCPLDLRFQIYITRPGYRGKVGYSSTGLTTPVGSLLSVQLTVLSRVIEVLVGFLFCQLVVEFSVVIEVLFILTYLPNTKGFHKIFTNVER